MNPRVKGDSFRYSGNVAASEHIRVLRERDKLRDQLILRTGENLIYRNAWNGLKGTLIKMSMIEAGADISPLIRALDEAMQSVTDEEPTKLLITLIELMHAVERFLAHGHGELVFAMTDDDKGRDAYRALVAARKVAQEELTKGLCV